MSFSVALSGLNSASTDLRVTSNNIANANTTAFKSSRAEFADVFTGAAVGTGAGVRLSQVRQDFAQGNVEITERQLDLAISGKGFFVVGDAESRAYTRAGAFKVDRNGFVVNASEQRLQVFPPRVEGGFNTSTTADLRLTSGESAPSPTGRVDMTFNLPGNAQVPTKTPFDPADADTYSHSTAMTVYDSLGAAHTATVYLSKTGTANTWEKRLYIDGNPVGGPQTLEYSDTGLLVTPATGELTYPAYTPATGAAPITLTYDLGASTQYGNAFSVSAINQDGYTTGRLVGVETDAEGVVQARFTNGRSVALGQIAIAQFASVDGLQTLGDTAWGETFASGTAMLSAAGTGGLGSIQAGALEGSNVDVTQQLVNMITAQRNFQANAKMISTADALSQTIINIR